MLMMWWCADQLPEAKGKDELKAKAAEMNK